MSGRDNEQYSSEESSHGDEAGIHHYGTARMGGKDGCLGSNGNGMGISLDGQ